MENNCGISMIGDDIAGIAAQADLPWPVYAADSGGVKGGSDLPAAGRRDWLLPFRK